LKLNEVFKKNLGAKIQYKSYTFENTSLSLLTFFDKRDEIMAKKLIHSVEITVYATVEELLAEDRELVEKAKKVSKTAYAPYSQFYVGAAIRLSSNKIIEGSNQENMAYPSGMCAERVAIYYANSFYSDSQIETIAVTAFAKEFNVNHPIYPCGACRQSMAEYELKQKKPIRLIMTGQSGEVYIAESIETILPFMFNEIELKKE
jgi:cytidine deaminase